MASILWLPVIFCSSAFFLYSMAINLPALDFRDSNSTTEYPDSVRLHFPSSIAELNEMSAILNQYTTTHPVYVLLLFCVAYIFKQTFAIPGSVFLNILAGSLFGVWLGFPLTCILTAVGATSCYLLSHFFGKRYVMLYFSERIEPIHRMIERDRSSLFLFLLSLRLFPMAPNWFMNITAPVLNIPVYLFFPSVLIGLMPYNFLCVEAGSVLSELTSADSIFTAQTVAKMAAAAAAALIPSILLKSYKHANMNVNSTASVNGTSSLVGNEQVLESSATVMEKTDVTDQ